MDEIFQDLLAVDQKRALDFFVLGLRDVSETAVDRRELMYNASVLTHYAQVSTKTDSLWPTPESLSVVFENFVEDTSLSHDSEVMEIAGTQCLLLAGFFEDQMRRRYNIRWYSELGSGFFWRAAIHERSSQKADLLRAISKRFELWRQRQAQLSRSLRYSPFILR